MLDAALPPSLGSLLQDIIRRLGNLEVGGQLSSSSITPGGYVRGYDAAGNRILEVGKLIGGGYGFAANTPIDLFPMFYVANDGWNVPLLYYSWREYSPIYVSTTSATFVAAWNCHLPGPMAGIIQAEVTISVDAATTGEFYYQLIDYGTNAVLATTNTVSVVGPALVGKNLAWVHGVAFRPTRMCVLRLFQRRSAGAANVAVGEPARTSVSNLQAVSADPLLPFY